MERLAPLLALALLVPASRAHADPPLDEDIVELSEHIAAHPEDVDALLERSELYARAGLGEDALADLRVAAALSPGDPRIPLRRAGVLHLVHRNDEALAELDALPASSFVAAALRARVLVALDRTPDAIAAYDEALALGHDVDLYLERGRLLEQAGRGEEAALGYHAGADATGALALRAAAIEVDLRNGRAERALSYVDELLVGSPRAARWRLLRGRALDALGRSDEARSARLEALAEVESRLARRPTAALHVDRGEALLALGRAEEALAAAARARSLAPRYGAALDLEIRARRVAGGAR